MDRPLLPFVAIAAIQRKAGSRKNVVVIEASYTAVHPAQPHKEDTFIKFVHEKLVNVSEVRLLRTYFCVVDCVLPIRHVIRRNLFRCREDEDSYKS